MVTFCDQDFFCSVRFRFADNFYGKTLAASGECFVVFIALKQCITICTLAGQCSAVWIFIDRRNACRSYHAVFLFCYNVRLWQIVKA